jgi:hypothetical protein
MVKHKRGAIANGVSLKDTKFEDARSHINQYHVDQKIKA